MTITTQEPTPESVWAFLQENARQMKETMKETDRRMQESDRRMKETIEEIMQRTDRRMEEADRQMQETDRRMKETDREMKEAARERRKTERFIREMQKETDRQIQETSREIKEAKDLFTTQWGRLMESLVDGSLVRLFNQRGIAVEDTSTRIKGSRQGHSYEFDIIGQEVIIVEVKTTLRPADVQVFLGKLDNARNWMPRYRDNIIHGAMAWLQANAGAERMAANKGLFSIRAVGDSAVVTNEPDFEPKPF
uniref:DUF3782 domain-containing protein n=2 Tax=Candidatus Kentrum sp. FM TaxID=2126340 RepID=A0A450W8Y1_9GAMM|nr:MAG: hypothetical protein BECKFM1743B_GA0114221_102823 [Candidatus Kentron sp. FM]